MNFSNPYLKPNISPVMLGTQTISKVIGFAGDPDISERLHDLSHNGNIEYLVIEPEDTLRRRLRASTNKGTDCAVALSRDQKLEDGSVLYLDETNAIVVKMTEERWLAVEPSNAATAIELGYFAGNLHWRVRFKGEVLEVAMEGPRATYVSRLQPFLDDAKVRMLPDA